MARIKKSYIKLTDEGKGRKSYIARREKKNESSESIFRVRGNIGDFRYYGGDSCPPEPEQTHLKV